MKNIVGEIILKLKKSRSIFIAGHERPDGDTAGASLALAHALKALGKKVTIRTKESLPEYLKFLPGAETIKKGAAKPSEKYDVAVILECSDMARMGNLITRGQARILVNIDHHLVNAPFGDINWIDPKASATCLQIFILLKKMRARITPAIAECLYTGILTDTGRFVQKNTTPETLEAAAELMRAGADGEKISSEVYSNRSRDELRLLARALSSVRTELNGKLALITLEKSDFEETATTWRDTEGFVNFPIMLKGALVAAFIRDVSPGDTRTHVRHKQGRGDDRPGIIKVSMRSKENVDLAPLVKSFGGGGHKHAAGFSLNLSGARPADSKSQIDSESLINRAVRVVIRETARIIKK